MAYWARWTVVVALALGAGTVSGCFDTQATDAADEAKATTGEASTGQAGTGGGNPGSADGESDGGASVPTDSGGSGTGPGDTTGGFDETSFGMDDDMPLVANIPDIKLGDIELGVLVELQNVVVTTPWATLPSGLGAVYVQEMTGDPYSGILLRLEGTDPALLPGDIVTLQGHTRQGVGIRYISVKVDDVVVHSAGADAAPLPVDIFTLTPFSQSFGAHEGMLVSISDVQVTELLPGTLEVVFEDRLAVDERFSGALPPMMPGQTMTEVVGVLMLRADGMGIGPRSAIDLTP